MILLLSSIVNHTGVATGCPFLLYVSRLIYACPESIELQLGGEEDDDIHSKFDGHLFLLLLSTVLFLRTLSLNKETLTLYLLFVSIIASTSSFPHLIMVLMILDKL